jgi:hypothetical protein
MKRHRSVLLKITVLGRCAARSDHFLVQSYSLAVRYLERIWDQNRYSEALECANSNKCGQ